MRHDYFDDLPVPSVPIAFPHGWEQRKPRHDGNVPTVPTVPTSNKQHLHCEPNGELIRALDRSIDGLPVSARDLYDSLAPEVIAQFRAGDIAASDLRTFAQELYEGREREAGRIPERYQCVATCSHCGTVWLTIPGDVPSCPWCINRYNGWPIPRPGSVTCATCRHFKRRNHAHLGDCGAGVKPYGAAGFWDTDPHACNRWLPNDKDSGRE